MIEQKTEKKMITAAEFDKIFDDGEEDVLQYCDLTKIRRPNQKKKQHPAGQ